MIEKENNFLEPSELYQLRTNFVFYYQKTQKHCYLNKGQILLFLYKNIENIGPYFVFLFKDEIVVDFLYMGETEQKILKFYEENLFKKL